MGPAILLLAFVSLILLLWLFCNYYKEDRIAKCIDRLPGSQRLPIIGTVYTLIFVKREDLFDFVQERFKFYKGLFRTWFGSVPVVHICKPEHAELILNNSIHITKSSAYDVLRPWLGDGLLLNKGIKWHTQRKLLTPAFHFKLLENALITFERKSITLLELLMTKANGEVFDIYPIITHCTLDIIYETAMGTQINSMNKPNSKYVAAIYEISDIITQRIIKPWLHPDCIFYNTSRGKNFKKSLKVLHNTTEKIIAKKRSEMDSAIQQKPQEDGRLKGISFIDILIETSKTNPGFTDKYIRDEIDTFLFEGHDTTTANICWTLFLLGNHLDIQVLHRRKQPPTTFPSVLQPQNDRSRIPVNQDAQKNGCISCPQLNKYTYAGSGQTAMRIEYTFLNGSLEFAGYCLEHKTYHQGGVTSAWDAAKQNKASVIWNVVLLEKVYEEIISVCSNSNLSIGCLGNLKLMERCLKEALRIYPSVPVIGRMLAEDISLGDYQLPAGCTANLYVFQIHRDEKYYPNPEQFDPDRFLPENMKGRHPYAFIPFSAGPRNCIGQKYAVLEEKVILAYILKHFRVKAIDSQDTIKPLIELILRPLNGIKIILERR